MSDGPDCLDVSQADEEASKNRLQVTSLGPDCRLGGLTEQAAHEAIAFCGTTGMILAGTLVGPGADANPGCQLGGGGEGGGIRSDLSNDLLGCLGANPRNLDQPHDRVLMVLHLGRRQLVQLLDLAVNQIDAVQVLGKQPAVDLSHRPGQGVPQWPQPTLQALVTQCGQSLRMSLTATQGTENSPSAHAQQIADDRGQLDAAFFEQALDLILQLNPLAN